jgi:F-type H+-transporting ATPase subunit delta
MSQAAASRYAKALADLVLGPNSGLDAAAVAAQLRAFSETLDGSPELLGVLLSPAVTTTRKRAVVSRVTARDQLPQLVKNFLFVIIDHRRIAILAGITEAFEAFVDERMGVVKASVSSARALDETQQSVLAAELARLTGRKVRCEFSTDPALVGGVAAKIGSRVYDGSVRGELSVLRRHLAQ